MSKIILIQPPDPPQTQILRDHMGKFGILKRSNSIVRDDILPPLDLAYSASLLENYNHEVDIIDSPTLGLTTSQILQRLINEKPNLVIINTSSVSIENDLDFATRVKNVVDGLIAVTGPHVTLFPEIALQRKEIDLVIRDEIEYTVLELSQKLSGFENIKGITYRKNGSIFSTPKRPFINRLNELPFPAYHLLPMEKYSYHLLKKKPFITVLSSRGCPFGCIYCPYPLGYGNIWRGRSPESVLAELKMLVEKYKVKSILFRDQVFTFDMKRTEKICDGIIQADIDIDWRCETRIDRLSKNIMSKMKKAGCVGIHVGVESGDSTILRKTAKVGIEIDRIKKIFREAKVVGLETVAFFIIGLPGETKESISRTLNLAKELKSNITWFTAAVPYPGTKLYELAERKGWILSKDFKKYSGRDVVMRTDNLSEEDIKKALINAKELFSKDIFKIAFSKNGISTVLSEPNKTFDYIINRLRRKLNVFKIF
jgi:radical SAM superfamily enzyme YgiQ (UPF0313 family)